MSDPKPPDLTVRDSKGRITRGRWAKGVSGNPGGRPKTAPEVRDAFRAHTAAALATLADLLANGSETSRARAAEVLLDRGWGRAPAVTAGEGGEGEAGLTITIRDLAAEAKRP